MSDNFLDITYETTRLIQSSVTENVLSDDIPADVRHGHNTKTLRILQLPSLSHLHLNNFLETSSFSCSMSFLTLLTTVFFFSVFLFSCSLFRPSIPFSLYENFFDHLSLAPGIFKYRMYIIYEDVINLKAVHNVPTLILFSPFISFWFAEHNNAQS